MTGKIEKKLADHPVFSQMAEFPQLNHSSRKKYTARYIQVLEAAAHEFSNKGYHVATTKDIAEHLGIQQGSLYYYIKSKESALEQICHVAMQGYVSFSREIRKSQKTYSEKLAEIIRQHLDTIDHHPDFFKVFLNHRHNLRDEVRHEIGRQIRQYEENIEAIIREGSRQGEFRPDIDSVLATLALLGMCNFVVVWWDKRLNQKLPNISEQYAKIFINGLKQS